MTSEPPPAYHYLDSLTRHQPIPENGILTRPIYEDAAIKVILFTFSEGQELSEHTASTPAVLHLLEGEARLTLGVEHRDAVAGAWVHMAPRLPHGIRARSPVRMLLYLFKSPAV